jgi:predicted Zn-dependent peptidase
MRNLRLFARILSAAGFVLSAAMWAPVRADTTPAISVETTRLPNGLEVVLHEDHRTPIVTINVWYHVGSKDEPAGKNGFAHLFEHMMFQGSKHVPEDAYFRTLERVGASDINGSTNTDRTNYFETVPKNQLALALWLESDRMAFLLDHVDQLTFAGQRDVVKNERRQNYENAPYGLVGMWIREQLFPKEHPYHLLTIGTPEDLDRASLDDVKQFFRTWYVPQNATLVIAGDVDKARALELVEKYFGPIAGNPPPARPPAPPVKLAGATRLEVSAGVELPRVYVSWPTPAFFAPGDGELDVVAHVLAGGKSSRLYKRLVHDLQIAQDVYAYQQSMQLASVFEITATAQPGHTADELLKAIDEELKKLADGGADEGEATRAKTIIRAQTLFDLERDSTRADRMNSYGHYTGDPGFLPKDLERYARIGAADVKGAMRFLPLDKRVVTVVTPVKGAPVSGKLDQVKLPGVKP